MDAYMFSPYDPLSWPEFSVSEHRGHGVYAAIDDKEIVYIGSATKLYQRIAAHRANPWFRLLDRKIRWAVLPADLIPNAIGYQRHEIEIIRRTRPKGNIGTSKLWPV